MARRPSNLGMALMEADYPAAFESGSGAIGPKARDIAGNEQAGPNLTAATADVMAG